jgi:hypothetical protein
MHISQSLVRHNSGVAPRTSWPAARLVYCLVLVPTGPAGTLFRELERVARQFRGEKWLYDPPAEPTSAPDQPGGQT